VKLEVLPGNQIVNGRKTYGPGTVADYGEDEAARLIRLGVAKALGEAANEKPPDTMTDTKTPEEKAAEKRAKAEKAAVKKHLGTAEEVAKLTDEELAKLFEGAKE
jgi:hypothetical protein